MSLSLKTRRLDDLATANLATIKLLKERREAIIAAAVTGQLAIPHDNRGASHAS